MRKLLTLLLIFLAAFSYSQTNVTFNNLDIRGTSKFRGLIYPFGASAKSPLSISDEVLMVELPSFKLVRIDFAEFADSITSYITIPVYTASNRNTLGWYSRQIGYDFQFRGVKSTDGYIDFLDSTTYIGLTLDTANLFDAIPIPPQYWTFVDAATDTLKNNVATVGVVAVKGNLELQTTNAAATNGIIKQNGVNLIHTYHEKGDNNLFIGQGSGNFELDSSFNIGIGRLALNRLNTSGSANIAIGDSAGYTTTNTAGNVYIGDKSGRLGTSSFNTGAGFKTLYNVTGNYNVAIGWKSQYYTTIGNNNVSVGSGALYNNTQGEENLAIGKSALYNNKENDASTAIGYNAMYNADSRTTGERVTFNTAVGYETMYGSASPASNIGQYNTATGYQALTKMTDANYNSVYGVYSGDAITTGDFNTVYGYDAGGGITTGDSNILIGASAGSQLTTESDQLYIDNTNTTTPLIYGNFRTDALTFNGDITYGDTFWDDLSTPATQARIGATSTPAFSYDSLALLWDNTPVDTTTQLIVLNYQLPHRWKAGSNLYLHVHYLQHSAGDTCEFFKATYKWTDMGETRAGAYTTVKTNNQTVYTYTSNALHQLASFPAISGAGHTESSVLQIVLYCYSDANLYSLDTDIHFEIDKPGSDAEFP